MLLVFETKGLNTQKHTNTLIRCATPAENKVSTSKERNAEDGEEDGEGRRIGDGSGKKKNNETDDDEEEENN